jgi:hypothetical protein
VTVTIARWKLAVLLTAVAAGFVSLGAGCGAKYAEPFHDAPRSSVDNGAPADLVRFPDGFSNWATKCDHGNRLYSAYHGDFKYAAGAVALGDPTCRGAR